MVWPALLATKLKVPLTTRELLARPRLLQRISAGLGRKLTLLAASAGFGKTTLLVQWVRREHRRRVAWLSLDAEDNDPIRFWRHVLASLDAISPISGQSAEGVLESESGCDPTALAVALINDLARAESPLVLVLDDYHVITEPAVHRSLGLLLEHLPRNVHLMMGTRADPPFPLARYRVRGELNELRAEDLRFTDQETAEFLRNVRKLDVPSQAVIALQEQTQGWIAALELAALSLQDSPDKVNAVRHLTDHDHWVADYYLEEVLHGLDKRVRLCYSINEQIREATRSQFRASSLVSHNRKCPVGRDRRRLRPLWSLGEH